MSEHDQMIGEVTAPPKGILGEIQSSKAIECTHYQLIRKNRGTAKFCRRRTSADIDTKKYSRSTIRNSAMRKVGADISTVDRSLVRVRHIVEIDFVVASLIEASTEYSMEFEASCLDTEITMYWSSTPRRTWEITITKYDLYSGKAELGRQLKKLESMLEISHKDSPSYLIGCAISRLRIVTKDRRRDSISNFTREEFIAEMRIYKNSLRSLLESIFQGNITAMSLIISREELTK